MLTSSWLGGWFWSRLSSLDAVLAVYGFFHAFAQILFSLVTSLTLAASGAGFRLHGHDLTGWFGISRPKIYTWLGTCSVILNAALLTRGSSLHSRYGTNRHIDIQKR